MIDLAPRAAVRPLAIRGPDGVPHAILTDAETRAAERALFDRGIAPWTLMRQAGERIAAIIAERFTDEDVLVACGPGNNGGDGYVIAAALRERGFAVRVAALRGPATEAARAARDRWDGPVEPMEGRPRPATILVDAVFGSGQTRPIDPQLSDWLAAVAARTTIVVDVPTGGCTDTGALLGEVGRLDLVIAIGFLKPVHLLLPAAGRMTEIEVAPIGLPIPDDHRLHLLTRRPLRAPDATANKYSRGKVVVVGAAMAGAAHLAAIAAQRSGAGYVELLLDGAPVAAPFSLVRRDWDAAALDDPRIGAIAIGPGLGDEADDRARVEAALATDRPLVLDAGALAILGEMGTDALSRRSACSVLTPHDGEFARLFGPVGDDRVTAARAAAAKTDAIVVLKGSATIVAAPDGRALIAPLASPWLATAGTGDVLTGVIATMLAQREAHGFDALAAVGQAVWLHARAADLAGPGMIADDLIDHLPQAITGA